MGDKSPPDYIYWMIFVVFSAVHYYTKTKGTPEEGLVTFFIILWVATFGVLLAMKVYGQEGRTEIIDYDENLQRWHLDYIIGGVMAVELIAFGIAAIATQLTTIKASVLPTFSAMWVPKMSLRFYDDILFNFSLVNTAEECTKILAIKAFYMKFGGTREGAAFSIGFPILFWALLHGYQSYVGYGEIIMYLMIFSAFLCGLVMFWAVKQTKNLLVAAIIHGLHNSIVVVASVPGLMPQVIGALIIIALAYTILKSENTKGLR